MTIKQPKRHPYRPPAHLAGIGVNMINAHDRSMALYALPGKPTRCMEHGQPYESQLLEHIYNQGYTGVAVDVGASIGNHTVWFAKVCELETMAFEPYTRNYINLQANLSLNGLDPYDIPKSYALGSRTARAEIVGKGRLEYSHNGWIRVHPLDAIYQSPTPPSFLKIDVEGMEAEVLEGARGLLSNHEPDLYTECWNEKYEHRIWNVIEDLGYYKAGEFNVKNRDKKKEKASVSPVIWWRTPIS